jgi:starch phosphorylase
MSEPGLERARGAIEWRGRVRSNWPLVKILGVKDEAELCNPLGRTFSLTVRVALGNLTPEEVSVQAVVGKVGPNRELMSARIEELTFLERDDAGFVFTGTVVCDVPGYQGYTVRVIPRHEDVTIPSELKLVAWE